MWRQSRQPDRGPVDLLTVEGFGANLAVRPGHATAMTRRGDQVTLHPPHLLSTLGKPLESKEPPKTKLRVRSKNPNMRLGDLRRAMITGWSWVCYLEHADWSWESKSRGGWERGGSRGRGWLEPGTQAEQTKCEQRRSVPRVSDPHYLLHTGLVILQCGSSLPWLGNTQKCKHTRGDIGMQTGPADPFDILNQHWPLILGICSGHYGYILVSCWFIDSWQVLVLTDIFFFSGKHSFQTTTGTFQEVFHWILVIFLLCETHLPDLDPRPLMV